jgi:hypothetical protein
VILTANLSPDELKQYKQRFYREAQAAGQMSHPGIITIHDVAEDDVSGQPYLVMEFVQGSTLDDVMTGGAKKLGIPDMLDIAIQVSDALDYATAAASFIATSSLQHPGHRRQPAKSPTSASPSSPARDHSDRPARRHARLHVARAAHRRPGRRPQRPLLLRRRSLLHVHRRNFPGDTVTSVIYKVMQMKPRHPQAQPRLAGGSGRHSRQSGGQIPTSATPMGAHSPRPQAVKLGRPLAGASQSTA